MALIKHQQGYFIFPFPKNSLKKGKRTSVEVYFIATNSNFLN